MITVEEKDLFSKAIEQLERGLRIWKKYGKNKTIEYLDSNNHYHEVDKKIVWKSLKNIRTNFQTENRFIRKITVLRLKKLSEQMSLLVTENKKGNLKFPKDVELTIKAIDSLIKYELEKKTKHLNKSIELASLAISENRTSNKNAE